MTHIYTKRFFDHVARTSDDGAERLLGLVRELAGPVSSVLDIGCGTGTWLRVAKEVWPEAEVHGVDHPDTPRDVLQVSEVTFSDLTQPLDLGRRFDLAISLEVAEHLAPEAADRFVANIAGHADLVLFSAAIPHQGGTHHVNEQWPDYWITRFAAEGLSCHDVLRPLIWDLETLPWWYRQNAMLFARTPPTALAGLTDWGGRAMVHPDCFLRRADPRRVQLSWAAQQVLAAGRRRLRL